MLHQAMSANLVHDLSGIQVMVGFTIQFNGVEHFILFDQRLGILDEQRFYLSDIVCLGKLDGNAPLIELNTGIDGLLDFVALTITTFCNNFINATGS